MSPPTTPVSLCEESRKVLSETLRYSSSADYAGYNKHDGLNSPILNTLLGWGKWPRILAIQAVMRSPVDPRRLLGVPKTRNPKGLALFASAWLDLWRLEGELIYRQHAEALLDWLLQHHSKRPSGLSWGYPYPWQDLGFFAPRHFPNRVVTCWIGFAFLEAARQTREDRYLAALPRIADFLLEEPAILFESEDMLCLSYVPDPSITMAVMDVPALVGAFLAESAALLKRQEYLQEASRLLNWVVDKQTDEGAWYYTHPPRDSHITHDNYHTAIILDCLDRYRVATGESYYLDAYRRGLSFYRQHLFSADGAPRWMSDKEYPYDIHGAGSAILCFTRAAASDPSYAIDASRVLRWTLDSMYDPRGFFCYQRYRYFTKRFCLLRWCNGWMSWAMAYFLRSFAR